MSDDPILQGSPSNKKQSFGNNEKKHSPPQPNEEPSQLKNLPHIENLPHIKNLTHVKEHPP